MPSINGGGDSGRITAGITAGLAAIGAGASLFVPDDLRVLLVIASATAATLTALLIFWTRRSQSGATATVAALAAVLERMPSARLITSAAGELLYANADAKDWLRGEAPFVAIAGRLVSDLTDEDAAHRIEAAVRAGAPLDAEIPVSGQGPEPDWIRLAHIITRR